MPEPKKEVEEEEVEEEEEETPKEAPKSAPPPPPSNVVTDYTWKMPPGNYQWKDEMGTACVKMECDSKLNGM